MPWLPSFLRRPGRKVRSDSIPIILELGSFDKGGLEKVVLDSALLLQARGFDVHIVTGGSVGYLGSVARDKGLSVHQLEGPNKQKPYIKLLREIAPALAISHFSDVGYPLFKSRGIPNVTFIHNVYAFLSPDEIARFRSNDSYVNRYISVSRNATRYAVEKLGIDANKIATIPNGLIISEHEAREAQPPELTRESFGLKPDDFVFANVASYNLHKGHYLMAAAMTKILERRADIKVLCIGNVVFPPHIEELRAYLADKGLDKHILMPGYYPRIQDVFRLSDAFLLASFIEGWSIAMNEAMFYGKPMILTDTGAAAEVIENEDIGILVPNAYGAPTALDSQLLDDLAYRPQTYATADTLAAAMIRMAEEREMWRQKGLDGRRKIYERFDFSDVVFQHEKVMRETIEKTSQSARKS